MFSSLYIFSFKLPNAPLTISCNTHHINISFSGKPHRPEHCEESCFIQEIQRQWKKNKITEQQNTTWSSSSLLQSSRDAAQMFKSFISSCRATMNALTSCYCHTSHLSASIVPSQQTDNCSRSVRGQVRTPEKSGCICTSWDQCF